MTPLALTNEIGKKFGADIYDSIKSVLSKATDITRAKFQIGFSAYFEANALRCEKVKTIINRAEPVSLLSIYEDCQFQTNNKRDFRIKEDDLLYGEDYKRVLVTGIAGSGKSFFMKRSFLRICEDQRELIPIFVELRHLNGLDKPDLLEYLAEQLADHVPLFSTSFFETILKECKVCLLLDGFDELFTSTRQRISRQIDKIAFKFPKIRIIVSGRPDDRFSAWEAFSEYQVAPLSKAACLSLIEKAEYPSDLKAKFRVNVENKLFTSHKEYLESPLMTYVMMLTADQFNEFPKEITAFYEKAFEVLYSGHDIMKSGDFQREVKCKIKLKELQRILGYFCALSFHDQIYEYTNKQATSYLDKALSLARFDGDSDELLYDISRNYCMLMQDGTNYSYIHRSFQEYLAAVCVSESEIFDYFTYVDDIVRGLVSSQRFLSMLREVGYERYRERYYLPTVKQFSDELHPIRTSKPRVLVTKMMNWYSVDDEGIVRAIHSGSSPSYFNLVEEVIVPGLGEPGLHLFSVKEDPANIAVLTDEQSKQPLNARSLSKIPIGTIRKLQMYKHIKKIVELARREVTAAEKEKASLKKLLN